jgi:hypothetical protein
VGCWVWPAGRVCGWKRGLAGETVPVGWLQVHRLLGQLQGELVLKTGPRPQTVKGGEVHGRGSWQGTVGGELALGAHPLQGGAQPVH